MSFGRKLKRGWSTENNKQVMDIAYRSTKMSLDKVRDKAYHDGSCDATAKVMAVACEIVYNEYGRLKNKDTRLKTFVTMLYDRLKNIDNPSDAQKEVERLLYKQCGIMIKR